MVSERRRSPRVRAPEGAGGFIRSTLQVHVEDISRTGVRFQLTGPVRPGSTYSFHAALDGLDLDVPIRITRCKVAAGGRGGGLVYQAGAEFLWETPKAAESLARWLERRGPETGQVRGDLRG